MATSTRTKPNIVISGNPGTGKTTLAKKIAEKVDGLRVIDFGEEAIAYDRDRPAEEQIREWHEASQSHSIDVDPLVDSLEIRLKEGGYIVDWMHGDIWSQIGLIDLVVTMRATNTVLYDRYKARGYTQGKIDENLDAEIFNNISNENQEYWCDDDTVELIELQSNSNAEIESNVDKIVSWINEWLPDPSQRPS